MSSDITNNPVSLPVTFQRARDAMGNLKGYANPRNNEPIRLEMRKNKAQTDWELVVTMPSSYQDKRTWPKDIQGVAVIVERTEPN